MTSDGALTVSGDRCIRGIAGDIEAADAIDAVRSFMGRFRVVPSPLPRFPGGLAGYFSYDLVPSLYPTVRANPAEDPGEPVGRFMLARDYLVLDHRERRLAVVANLLVTDEADAEEEYHRGRAAVAERVARIRDLSPARPAGPDPSGVAPASSCTPEEFSGAVVRVKEHIAAGDIFQAVVSRRLTCRVAGDPFGIYRRLRAENPSPYMYYLDFSDLAVAGSSPETRRVERPGTTVPMPAPGPGETGGENGRARLPPTRERSEHIMLRRPCENDVGRSAPERLGESSSWTVGLLFEATSSPRLGASPGAIGSMHSGLFPGGNVSGAPKVRARDHRDVENLRPRGHAGRRLHRFRTMDFAIAIRTVISWTRRLRQVGGGLWPTRPGGRDRDSRTKAGDACGASARGGMRVLVIDSYD